MNLKFTKRVVGVAVVASALFFSSCSESMKQGSVKDLDVAEFSELIQQNDTLILINVDEDNYGDVMISGAIAYPIATDQDAANLVKKHGTKKPYAIYDLNGVKSRKAADMIAKHGANAYNLKKGLSGWIEEDQLIIIMPIDSTMTTPITTTKSKIMADSTLRTKLKLSN